MVWTEAAKLLVDEVLGKNADEVDRSSRIPASHFDELAARGFYGFAFSDGMTPETLIDTVAEVIGGCLATGFVWAQHLGALRAVAFGANDAVREQYLKPMTAGEFRCGISYAGARTKPTLFAEPVGDGYALTGFAPFVTGWDFVDAVVTSARAGDDVVTILLPRDTAGITTERLHLIAADASATVRAEFDGAVVAAEHVIGVQQTASFASARGSLADWINGALALGVLRRCIRQLADLDVGAEGSDGGYAAPHQARFDTLRARFVPAAGDADATYALRAEIAEAALAAAAAGVVATGSRATAAGSTPERLVREATFALVCTTREPIKLALLDRLAPR